MFDRENQKVISKINALDNKRELENQLTSLSLYTLVTCNRYKIREKLTGYPVSFISRQIMIIRNIVSQMYRAFLTINL